MREIQLSRPATGNGSKHLYAVLADLEKISSRRVKIYQTYISSELNEYVLVTTSKDIQLSLSLMSRAGQIHFAELLAEEFATGKCCELLVLEPESKKGILATLPHKIDGGMIFHLSPAY